MTGRQIVPVLQMTTELYRSVIPRSINVNESLVVKYVIAIIVLEVCDV
jgi:hypothetical protein